MKGFPMVLCCLFPALLAAQTPDSTAIKQVDSLVQVSRALTNQGAFDNALEVIAVAEAIALEKLGRESASYGKTCHNHGRVLQSSGNLQDAEKWYLEAIAIREKTLGKQHPDYAWSLNNLGMVYEQLGNYEKAEPLYLEALAIREKVLGKENPDYAQSLNNLGLLYYAQSNFEKAESLQLEALAIREKVLGKENPDYAQSLNNLGLLYYAQSNFEKAESLQLEALAIKEKVLGKENPDYAGSLINLASLYGMQGNYEKAEPLCLEAKTIFEDRLNNREHPYYANCLINLATMYNLQGNYEKAEQLYLEALVIREKVLGKDHPEYSQCLEFVGETYYFQGNYEKAEQFYLEIKTIFEDRLNNREHPVYLNCLAHLAVLYADMGNYGKAEPLLLEAKTILEKVLGKENSFYADNLNALAGVYADMGNYEKVEPLYLEALAIREKVLGKDHPQYAGSLINLANIYADMGNYEKAEPLLREAKTIFEDRLNNREHIYYINCLVNLATLDIEMGNYEKAEPLLLDAKTIREKVLGKEHPDYAKSLGYLALLYGMIGNYAKAEPFYIEESVVNQSLLERAVRHLSERELGSYLNKFSGNQDIVLSFAQQSASKNITPTCFDNELFYKGFLLQSAGQVRRMAQSNQTANETFIQLKAFERRLATQYTLPIAERDSMTIVALETQVNNLEKELASRILGTGYAEATRQVKWQDVQATLKAGDAAIEFVHYKVDFPQKADSVMYAALLLLPLPAVDLSKEGGAEQPQFIPLFEAKQLDALLKPANKQKVDWVNQLYAEIGNDQNALYELLWKPLEPALAGVQTIYFSPSGQLHRLNLGAIVLPPMLRGPSETTTLGDRYRLIEVGSTRQLVTGSGQQATDSGNQAMLFGGIQYEPDTTAMDQARPELENSSVASRSRGLDFASTDSTLRGGKWKYLPWTKVEVTALDGILTKAGIKATMRKDYEASEEAFKSLGVGQPSPRILHLATHGFFFPDPKTADGKRLTVDGSEPVFKMSDHPMIRSGLLMAGGNYAWEKGKPFKPGAEDGILTAYEISQMDLSNTELVVLSACETGLGDIQGNEGVYGLQRAFKIAGAKYLIMSLWQVPDFQTQQLMSAFYRNWLQDKMSIPDAFRAAQQAMQLKFKDPFFWAGFVLVE